MTSNIRYDFIGEGAGVVFTAMQPNEVFQYISLALTIISILVSLGFTIYKWYKEAKKDGKITKDEITDLVDKTKDDATKLVDTVKDIKDKNKEEK